jgi:hypothetical protein
MRLALPLATVRRRLRALGVTRIAQSAGRNEGQPGPDRPSIDVLRLLGKG